MDILKIIIACIVLLISPASFAEEATPQEIYIGNQRFLPLPSASQRMYGGRQQINQPARFMPITQPRRLNEIVPSGKSIKSSIVPKDSSMILPPERTAKNKPSEMSREQAQQILSIFSQK